MTGKGCVYTQIIEDELRQRGDRRECGGFLVVPFRENFEVFHRNCLEPFLSKSYGTQGLISLHTADTARRPGVVICEGVCKRIQESHFIIVDISTPNPNVFYELGLAYGLAHNIVPIHHIDSAFGARVGRYLGCTPYGYMDLDPLSVTSFDLAGRLWTRPSTIPMLPSEGNTEDAAGTILYELGLPDRFNGADLEARDPDDSDEVPARADTPADHLFRQLRTLLYETASTTPPGRHEDGDIRLSFRTHLKSAFGLAVPRILDPESKELEAGALAKIRTYEREIRRIQRVRVIKETEAFHDVRALIETAYCTVVRTGFQRCHPMAYFWLGYAHARGKNVVPITVISRARDPIDDLAFDIRAQRHMTFVKQAPKRLEEELRHTLKHIIATDFAIWSRKRFWDEILGRRGEVHIFTGALTHSEYRREVVGDWDLRSASELNSYLTRHEYRATIASPIYNPERALGGTTHGQLDYVRHLGSLLSGKNCIIVASPDVNAFTEIVLGAVYELAPDQLFSGPLNLTHANRAIVAVKEVSKRAEGSALAMTMPRRALYFEQATGAEGRLRRGFKSLRILGGELMHEFVNQMDAPGAFTVSAHLAIVPNLFTRDGIFDRSRLEVTPRQHIIVLNGLSGPATFALTHVLTGGVSEGFVAYERERFDATKESEEEVSGILRALEDARRGRAQLGLPVVERIYTVSVVPEEPGAATPATKDWRQISSWTPYTRLS